MSEENYCIGIDFGTDSVRAVIADARDGRQIASSVFVYPRYRRGDYCKPGQHIFRQHPLDYIEGLTHTVRESLGQAGASVRSAIRAISIDTTGSSPVAVDETGTPLALVPGFEDDPDAMFVLWKDHSAAAEMAEINAHAKLFETDYLRYVGGIYSSEWFWSKLLHVLRGNERVRKACYSWVEHCDWMPFLLTGGRRAAEMKRGVCTAAHKALWSDEWGGLPPAEFFTSLDPLLAVPAAHLYKEVYAADRSAGFLCSEWADKLGLSTNVIIGIGAMDAHMGAVGGQIAPYHLSKVMGTSTCDMLVAPTRDMEGKYVPGICGLADGSIIPGMVGMEAGQSAFGDVYAWLRELVAWPLRHLSDKVSFAPGYTMDTVIGEILPALSREAEQLVVTDESELSIDWLNGRRTPDADPFLTGSISGISLGTQAPALFRSLAEATCFGSRAIVERFIGQGIPVKGIIGIGGIARRSPFIMQMLADVLNKPIRINKSEQTSALGAAMFAATAAGLYKRVEDAMQAMGQGFDREYMPNPRMTELYNRRYESYRRMGEFIERNKTVLK
ncbi:MAG TPA: ribulokinase [Puia sp.]|jgi:L-ribulokinase